MKKRIIPIIIAVFLIASLISNIVLAVNLNNTSNELMLEKAPVSFYLKEIISWSHNHDEPDPYFEGRGYLTCENDSKVFLEFPPSENSRTFTISEKINDLARGSCKVEFFDGFGSQHFSIKLHYLSKHEWNGKLYYEIHLEGAENTEKTVWILP